MKIAFIDTETTGLNFLYKEIIEIAILVVDDVTNKVISENQFFIEAQKRIDESATKVNGYYVGKWGNKSMNPKTVAYKVKNILKESDVIIAHNASFDRAFVGTFLFNNGYNFDDHPKYFIDNMTLAFLFKKAGLFERVSLDHCLEKLGMQNKRSKEHSALEDTKLLREVYFALMKRIKVN